MSLGSSCPNPGAKDKLAKQGQIAFDFGNSWTTGLSMGTGQAPPKRYDREPRDLIHLGKAKPSLIVSREITLAGAPDAYEHFNKRDDGWTKVLLHLGQ